MWLEVHRAIGEDVYRDLVRIPESFRKDPNGRRIRESTVCQIAVKDRSTLVSVRGLAEEARPIIRMDEKTRLDLGIIDQKEYEFVLTPVGWVKQFRWAWNSSDPTAR